MRRIFEYTEGTNERQGYPKNEENKERTKQYFDP